MPGREHMSRLAGALVALLAAAGCASAPARPSRGFNDGFPFLAQSQAELVRWADDAQRVGATTIRTTLLWTCTEPVAPLVAGRHVYRTDPSGQLGRLKTAYDLLLARGIRMVVVVADAPPWARDAAGPACADDTGARWEPPTPDHYADYAALVTEVARRFPQLQAIEAWNEPNYARFWWPAPDPAAYAQLLVTTRSALRAAAPAMPLLSAGLMGFRMPAGTADGGGAVSYDRFLRTLYRRAGAGAFDGIAIHPYLRNQTQDGLPTADPDVLACPPRPGAAPRDDDCVARQVLRRVRAVRDAAGDRAKRLWITETGASTTTDGPPTGAAGGPANFGTAWTAARHGRALVAAWQDLGRAHDVAAVLFNGLFESTPRTAVWTATAGSESGYGVVEWTRPLLGETSFRYKPGYCALAAVWRGSAARTLTCSGR